VLCALAYPVTITSDMKSSTNRIHTGLIQNVLRCTVVLSETMSLSSQAPVRLITGERESFSQGEISFGR